MSYIRCISAKIIDEGRGVELSFKDDHSCSASTITMPAEEWNKIIVYQCAYEEPERRLADAHKNLCRFLWDEAMALSHQNRKSTGIGEVGKP